MVLHMGLFSKKPKAPKLVDLTGVPVNSIVDSDEFIDSNVSGKETSFRIARFTEAYFEGHLRFEFGNTHEAIVVRGKGTKEYEALLTIKDRTVVKSFVVNFYG